MSYLGELLEITASERVNCCLSISHLWQLDEKVVDSVHENDVLVNKDECQSTISELFYLIHCEIKENNLLFFNKKKKNCYKFVLFLNASKGQYIILLNEYLFLKFNFNY